MTYVEMTELFKKFGLTFDPPLRDGMYWVYYLDEPFCNIEKHKKLNRSIVFFKHIPGGHYYLKEVTTADLTNRITGFILKIKQRKLNAALKQINSDF
jgi:hypothetical protein